MEIPAGLWQGEELNEKGTLLKDVRDMVWDYLRVYLPRILNRMAGAGKSPGTRVDVRKFSRDEGKPTQWAYAMDGVQGIDNQHAAEGHRSTRLLVPLLPLSHSVRSRAGRSRIGSVQSANPGEGKRRDCDHSVSSSAQRHTKGCQTHVEQPE